MKNLDCMDHDDLRTFADKLLRAPKFSACDNRGVMLGNLHSYALGVIDASTERLAGNIARALRIEACMDTIYTSLPQKHRW